MSEKYEELKQKALACGFSHVGDLDADTIQVKSEVRSACAENKCQHYNKNWVCPPGCGTLEECSRQIHKYSKGLIVQTTGELEDSFDIEGMQELGERHKEAFHKFAAVVREEYPGALVWGTGHVITAGNVRIRMRRAVFPSVSHRQWRLTVCL